jgi:hypothetical protein
MKATKVALLAWWFFYQVPGSNGPHLAGPFDTLRGCDVVRNKMTFTSGCFSDL